MDEPRLVLYTTSTAMNDAHSSILKIKLLYQLLVPDPFVRDVIGLELLSYLPPATTVDGPIPSSEKWLMLVGRH